MQFSDLIGHDLGKHRVTYSSETAILYALAVGAAPDQLELTYERDLRVLPCFGTALGLWAVEKAGDLGAYDRKMSLHASQELVVHKPLPKKGDFEMTGRVAGVWDKGRATMVDIVAECEYFSASYGIFLPGRGGWGGERGPASAAVAAGGAALAARAARSTSSTVTPPSGPLPARRSMSTPRSSACLRAAGEIRCAAAAVFSGGGTATGVRVAGAASSAPSSVASTVPTGTVSPG